MNNLSLTALATMTVCLMVVSGLYLQSVDDKILVEVQTGQKALYCHMADGYRQIEASKINGFDSSRWYFSRGGSAKACKVI